MTSFLKLLRTHWVHILIITFIGAILRFWGILHGFQEGFNYHPDTSILGDVWSGYLEAHWGMKNYSGPIFNFLSAGAISIMEFITGFLGYRPEWSFEFLGSISMLLSAVLGTATIPIVYLMTAKAYDKPSGVLAALIVALCPLQSYHSHYPYRDVPMAFFEVITLYLCILIIHRHSLSLLAFMAMGGLAAVITASLKPAGMVVAAPLFVASLIALVKSRKVWLIIPVGIIFIGSYFLFTQKLNIRFMETAQIKGYFLKNYSLFFNGSIIMLKTFKQWIGLSYILSMALAIGYSVWRRQTNDLVLLSFLFVGFFSAAIYPEFDDRYLVFLLPALAVLLGRFIVEVWRWSTRWKPITMGISIIVGLLFLNAFIQSVWQGVMFSLPDTRSLSGKWAERHLSKTTKIAMEAGYGPLQVNEWPNAFCFDTLKPFKEEVSKTDIFITSSLEYQRYLDKPYQYPKEVYFYKSITQEAASIKRFYLMPPTGFIQPIIEIFLPPYSKIPSNKGGGKINYTVPRPYDASWNGGVSFLDQGPIDRDDRSFFLGWQHRHTATLVSPIIGQEMVVFMINGPEKSVVRVRVGFKSKIRTLKPGEFHILTFRPKWFFPKKPALYHFEAGLPEGKKVFIQLRCGNREIGGAYAKWGYYDKALTYLERAVVDDPNDAELRFLLGMVYSQLGRLKEAQETLKGLMDNNPQYIKMVLSLGQSDLPVDKWEQLFRDYTNLNSSLLTYALSQEFNTEKAFPSRSGVIKKDCEASGGQNIVFEKTIHKPDEVMHGPYVYLDQGAYRTGFFLRTWNVTGSGPLAVIKVLADDHIISMLYVRPKDLSGSGRLFKEIHIPFQHPNPRVEIKFQVFATGSASFAVDKIRIEPDIRKIFQEKFLNLKTIAGDNLLVKDKKIGLN